VIFLLDTNIFSAHVEKLRPRSSTPELDLDPLVLALRSDVRRELV
jgi:hypothetical protein